MPRRAACGLVLVHSCVEGREHLPVVKLRDAA